jgi:hypothetical protein
VQVLGVRDQRQEREQGERVQPPQDAGRGGRFGHEEGGQVSGHEGEDQEGDEAGFPGELFTEPLGADEEAADEEAEDADGAGQGEGGGEVEVPAAE